MANGHVEIHDPISNQNGHTGTTDSEPKTSSDTSNIEDTQEYRLLRVYSARRRPEKKAETDTRPSLVALNGGGDANGTTGETEAMLEEKKDKKKKKKGWKRMSSILRCVKPQTDDNEKSDVFPQSCNVESRNQHLRDVTDRCFDPGNVSFKGTNEVTAEDEDELDEVANRLIKLADEIKLSPSELDTDSGEDDVEKIIGLLLREQGDKLDEKLKEANIRFELFSNYSFFERVMNTLLTTTGYRSSDPNSLGPQASQKTQIAVTCEITSRLSAVDTLPMSRLLHHGARYLQVYYSGWAQQQGGYEVAIESDDEDVE